MLIVMNFIAPLPASGNTLIALQATKRQARKKIPRRQFGSGVFKFDACKISIG